MEQVIFRTELGSSQPLSHASPFSCGIVLMTNHVIEATSFQQVNDSVSLVIAVFQYQPGTRF